MAKTKKQRLRQKKAPKNTSAASSTSAISLKNEHVEVRLKRSTRSSRDAFVSSEASEVPETEPEEPAIEKEEPKLLVQSAFLQHSKRKADRLMKRQASTSGEWKVEPVTEEESDSTDKERDLNREKIVAQSACRQTRSASLSDCLLSDEIVPAAVTRKRKSEVLDSKSVKKPQKRGGKRLRGKRRTKSESMAIPHEESDQENDDSAEEKSAALENAAFTGTLTEHFSGTTRTRQAIKASAHCLNKDEKKAASVNEGEELSKCVKMDIESEAHDSDSANGDLNGDNSSADDSSVPMEESSSVVSAKLGHCKSSQQIKYRVFVLPSQDEVLVVFSEGEELTFQGHVTLKCLYGCVKVMGYNVTSDKDALPLFSTESYCLLPIKGVMRGNREGKNHLASSGEYEVIIDDLLAALDSRSVVISLSRYSSPEMDFVCSIHPFQDLFRSPPSRDSVSDLPAALKENLDIEGPSREQAPVFRESADYIAAATKLSNHAAGSSLTVAVCGGKNVGKSTFCRFLLNRLLNRFRSVAFLECDLGQTEFSAPGCVSLHLISTPLLGPAFTHQRKAERMVYVGVVTPANDPSYYIRCLQYVFQTYSSLPGHPPLIINTMGWNKGMGLMLLADTLRMTSPNYVVQLNSPMPSRNLPKVTSQFVMTTQGCDLQPVPEEGFEYTSHELISFLSPDTSHLQNTGFRPTEFRDMAMLSYLGQLGRDSPGPPDLLSYKPYHIPWNLVAVHISHESVAPSQIMYALNASVVGLCIVKEEEMVDPGENDLPKLLKENPVCECIGFGVVRAIDAENKELLVTTPVSPSDLLEVNCLIGGIVGLPQQLVLNQEAVDGNIPYVSTWSTAKNDVVGGSAIKPRRHIFRKGDK